MTYDPRGGAALLAALGVAALVRPASAQPSASPALRPSESACARWEGRWYERVAIGPSVWWAREAAAGSESRLVLSARRSVANNGWRGGDSPTRLRNALHV